MSDLNVNSLPYLKELDCRSLRLSLKKVQTFSSPDGGGFNADLYWDGKKIATAHQGGYGGPTDICPEHGAAPLLQGEVKAYVASLPRHPADQYFPEGLERSLDLVIEELVNWNETKKWLKRKCKTQVMFQYVPIDGPDWPTDFARWTGIALGMVPVEKVKAYILSKDVPAGMKVIFADAFI